MEATRHSRALRLAITITVIGGVVTLGGLLYLRSLLSAESIAGILNAAIAPATDELYRVRVADTSFSISRGDLRLDGVELVPDTDRLAVLAASDRHPALRFSLAIDSLSLDGLSLVRLMLQRHIVATSVVVDQAEVVITIDPDPPSAAAADGDTEDEAPATRDDDPAQAVSPAERLQAALVGIPTIAVERVAIEDAALRIDTLERGTGRGAARQVVATSDVVGRIDIEFRGLLIDEKAGIERARSLYTDDIRLRVSEVETRQLGGSILRLGELTASSKEEHLEMAGLSFTATATMAEYLDRTEVAEPDRVNVLVDSLVVDGFAFTRYMANLDVFVRAIAIDGFRVDVLSDKHKPSTPRDGPAPMPHDFFQGLDTILTIETITLANGEVSYSERAPDGNEPGTVSFRDVSAHVTNVSNDPARMSPETPAILEARTLANDTADVTVQWRIPLLSPRPTMTTLAQIASFDPAVLNTTLEPLLGVRVKSGHIDSVAYEFQYSPDMIRGELDAAYTDLGIELVNKNTGESSLGRKILGFMANAVAIRSNNPSRPGAVPRRGILEQPLEPQDPFFKLIWIALRDGMAEIAARIG